MATAAIPMNTADLNDAEAWRAVAQRDGSADGSFVYAVKTTGIFCRPSCPSRRPARENVVFFPDVPAAASAGFRPCRRCRPEERHAEAVMAEKLAAYLRSHADRQVKLDELGRIAGISPFTIQRLFQRVMGVSPAQYQRQLRGQAFRRELAGGEMRVTDAVYEAGYSGPGRAYESGQLGMQPGQYRAGGRGQQIRYTIGTSPLGKILIAATERGLCTVIPGESAEELKQQLHEQFPAAQLSPGNDLDGLLEQVLSQMTEHPAALDLSLDLRATAFQMRVWEALRRIPRGETRSYAEVARSLGQPSAVRAVARACASNPAAVVIPCHRVIGSNGSFTGYRWGVERKKKLLEIEKTALQ
ncbi:bifunctional DNA-binding transcriptional regulator/O6-methylguanine-DNA methyltransferase Ada [Paracidobacterium acidisoli]|uniref:methylated-DNA--[protein]-cysteine S-methyltransferase n=1 Tax=Paracidobacterium acidisoli TaxID=2303751 RepID=A0A372IN28_9BACT|nr:bifunctional DNA-binding transcriptional regulator/O6-methylguanine-DNA methyltransferase Ada [Paracidobacterium acidisoli]MBT9331946.1 bifunctional DNA-binding transcriptional regulator/O6-methylguanine-DNA methyltransferase Ada [Paracidobacterium acidisoli]